MKCGNSNELIHKDVVIIGNGPSGIALSYMLSGNIPYVTSTAHPDELLSIRLEPILNQSLVNANLQFLSNGLEGRTTNPVSLLLDSLAHPCADIGLEMDPLVQWRPTGRKFKKFGHKCEIQSTERELTNFEGSNLFRRWFNRLRMINETNQRSYSFLRSQKKIENEHKKILEYSLIIHPFSDFKKYWEIFICFILMLQMIMIPLDVAFYHVVFEHNIIRSKTFIYIRIITDVFSFIDVIICFLCGYCDLKQTTIIINPAQIAKHYLRHSFILDLYSSIPIDVLLNFYEPDDQMKLLRKVYFMMHYLGLLKLARYYYFVKYTATMFEATMNEMYYIVHRLSIAIITFVFYLHLICCCSIAWTVRQFPYHYLLADTPAIIKSYGTDIVTMSDMYSRFFYAGCLMVLNAGYGLPSYNRTSILFITHVWLCSRLLYILAIAIHSSTQKYVDMICEVKDYMRHRQIPNFLQKRIISYYDIKFQSCFFQESDILNTVSGQLRQEIIMNTCRKLVEEVSFFKNLPLSLMVRIVSSLSYDIFLTNDVIAKVGTVGDCMYFIFNGTVAVYAHNGKELCHLQDGDYFGEVALIMKDSTRVASVIAAEVCELYRLDRKDFVKAILPYPDLYDKIVIIAAERKLSTSIVEEAQDVRDSGNVMKYSASYVEAAEVRSGEALSTIASIDHVVLGKGPAGGSWHAMDPEILTLSLGSWMSLPGMKYESKNSSEKRATAKSVADYYQTYVNEMDLSSNFRNHVLVTKIEPYVMEDTECKSKWVEKVNNDKCQKIRLCSRPERKDLARSKSHCLSNAFNYILNRGQERCQKRSWEQNDTRDELPADNKFNCDARFSVRKKRDIDRARSSTCACELSCNQCHLNNEHSPVVPEYNYRNNCDLIRRQSKWIVEAMDLDSKTSIRFTCNNLVLANGSSDLPNKLNISKYKTDPYWLLHDLRSLEIELDLHLQNNPIPDPVLVVGAGLSAADAIIATKARNVPVVHLFRNKTDLSKQLPENMYPEYHKVHQMMKNGTNYPMYTALAEYTLTNLDEHSHKATIMSKEGKSTDIVVSHVIVLIGSQPDMSFLPQDYNLGVKKQLPIDGKKNTAHIDKLTHQVYGHEGLYAIGPLAGDNFVRFLPGGALAVLSDIYRKTK